MVYQVASRVKLPVIGMGGIWSGADVLEFLIAGARAVQVGTANLVDPDACPRILGEVEDYCRRKGIDRLENIIATVKI
jgi:dihydroorotate dehydrogenase (NAD+) catalytic subunit